MKMKCKLLILLIQFACLSIQAATITSNLPGEIITIEGRIDSGDFQHILELIRQDNHMPSSIFITSPGGDVLDAINIGRFARRALITVWATKECNSSCFIILVGGVERFINTPIGLHRPKYDDSYFSGLSALEARIEYDRIDSLVREYYLEMRVPNHLIDKIMSTPSSRMHVINEIKIIDEIGQESPFFNEWIVAKCGALSPDEEEDYLITFAKQVYEIGLQDKDDYYNYVKNKSNEMSSGYKKYLGEKVLKIANCKNSARDNERHKALGEILKAK